MDSQDRGVAVDEEALVLHDAGHRVGHPGVGGGAGVPPVEVLELLDRVGRLADPQPLPHDGEQVDEPLPPQQRVELGLAGAVPPGQPLEGGLLVGRVVVDVCVRVGGQPAGQLVEQVAGQRRLLVVVVRPPGAEPSAAVPEAGEVLPAPAVGGERVALEVEVDVAVARRRQAQQPAVGLRRQQLVGGLRRWSARSTCRRACWASRSRDGRPIVRGSSVAAAAASASTVGSPAAIRACRCPERMPATSERSSACSHRVVQCADQRHCEQCGTGAGSVSAPVSTACCRRARARRA